jgi:hypothetical protein
MWVRHLSRLAGAAAIASMPGVISAQAQRVILEVRPRPGDTLRVTLDHTVTISGGPRNAPDSATTITTSYHVATRDAVERADAKGTVVRALVDSVRMRTTGSIGASPFPGVDRGMEGMKVRLQIMPDGSSNIIDGLDQLDPELIAMLGAMPAVLPITPVSVGDSWVRELPLPADGSDASSAGSLRATFKFDSLTENGDIAWISLQGRVTPVTTSAKAPASGVTHMTGTLTGQLRLDRRRGWLSESHATVSIESVVVVPGGGSPLLVKVRVNQVMHTAPPRR